MKRIIKYLLLFTSLSTLFSCGKASVESAKELLNNTTTEPNFLKGEPSADFGAGTGIVSYDAGSFSGPDKGVAVAFDSNGNIVVGGDSFISSNDMAVWRYRPDGTLDTSFGGGDGFLTHSINGSDYVEDMAFDSLGNIILVGRTLVSLQGNDLAVWKVTPSGTLDTSFGGGNGYITHRMASGQTNHEEGYSVAIDSNDNIIVVGRTTTAGSTVWKFSTTGILDTSFGGGDGITQSPLLGAAYGVTVDENDNIYTAGVGTGINVVKYDSNGNLDLSFSGDGVFVYNNPSGGGSANDIIIDANGNVVITGYLDSGTDRDMLVMRLTPTGVLDTTFGSGQGYITHHNAASGNGNDIGNALTIDSDGNILAIGTSVGANTDLALWKISPTGSLVTSFGNGDGFVTFDGLAGKSGFDMGNGLALTDSGKLAATGMSEGASTSDDMVLFLLE